MKVRILLPLFAALVFTGTARSQNPTQPRPDGPAPGGPMAERLKSRIEQFRRDGKHEEAERFAHNAREMWERRRGNPQGGGRSESHRGAPPENSGERTGHLAEAARHLNAAGIHVSPEMLERLGHWSAGKTERRPGLSHGPSHSAGEHAGEMPGRPPLPPGGNFAPSGSARVDAMHKRFGGTPEHPAFPPTAPMGAKANAAPGAGSPVDAMHNEIRALAQQVQELRGMIQQQRGGGPGRVPQGPGFQRPGVPDHPRAEHEGDRPAVREHRESPPRPQGENHPRGEARPPGPPPNQAPLTERPRGGAPIPPAP